MKRLYPSCLKEFKEQLREEEKSPVTIERLGLIPGEEGKKKTITSFAAEN